MSGFEVTRDAASARLGGRFDDRPGDPEARALRTVVALYDEVDRLQLALGASATEVEMLFLDVVAAQEACLRRMVDGWEPSVGGADWQSANPYDARPPREPMTDAERAVMESL